MKKFLAKFRVEPCKSEGIFKNVFNNVLEIYMHFIEVRIRPDSPNLSVENSEALDCYV